jgi:hypothetical protein
MVQIVTRVVGTRIKNSDGSSRQKILLKNASKGQVVTLRRDPHEDRDPNAIEVLIDCCEGKPQQRIGYLPGRVGERVSGALGHGKDVNAVISTLTPAVEGGGIGIGITITY